MKYNVNGCKEIYSNSSYTAMSTIGLKIKDSTYERLKWLKTRFEFVHESTMSWDEFFERLSKDVLVILAQDLKEKSGEKISLDNLLSIVSGTVSDLPPERIDSKILSGHRAVGDESGSTTT